MGFMFAHLENYSRKGSKGRSVGFVLAEARRDPAASGHVVAPRPPESVWGCSLEELERQHDEGAAAARAMIAGGKTRAVRRDQHTLCTVVMSHPYTVQEVEADPAKLAEVHRWEHLNVAWLRAQYGANLRSVVRHTDERHWHLHGFALPGDPAMRASLHHPGQVAKAAELAGVRVLGESEKDRNRRGDRAYRAAMRVWQDGYFQAVGVPAGLTRLGPAKRRLRRVEWQAEQVQAKALQDMIERTQALRAEGRKFVARVRASASHEAAQTKVVANQVLAHAHHEAERARKSTQEAAEACRRAEAAETAAKRWRGLSGRLRAFLDGFRVSRVRAAVAVEFGVRLDQAQRLLGLAQDEARFERDRRREVEVRLGATLASVRELAAQRDTARAELQHMAEGRHGPEASRMRGWDR